MFDEGQEVFCIVAILVLWCLSLVSLIFLLPAMALVLYVVYDVRKLNNDDEQDVEPKVISEHDEPDKSGDLQ